MEKAAPSRVFLFPEGPWLPVHGTGVPIGDPLQAIGRSVRVRVALFIVRALEKLQFHAGSCEIYASRAAADARGVSPLPKREQEVAERVVEGLFTSTSSMVEGKGSIALCRRPPAKIVVSKYSF